MLKYASDPNSELNRLRRAKQETYEELKEKNRKKSPDRGRYLARYNNARLALKYFLEGKKHPERHNIDYEVTIHGIPAGVVILDYRQARPWRQHTFPGAGPGDCDPPEDAEVNWMITDRKGYESNWLFEKVDEGDFDSFVLLLIEDSSTHPSFPRK